MKIFDLFPDELNDLIALQPEGWPDIRPHFQFYFNSSFCSPIKLVADKKIVGIGSCIYHRETAWLGHIIVHKEFRNQGIGTKITQALVERALEINSSTISLIATELGEPVYAKLGFRKESDYCFFTKELTDT